MNDAFREQLLKAGVVTKKQAKAAAHEENVGQRQRRKQNKNAGNATPELSAAEVALEEKRARDRALNQQREAERSTRARHAEVDDLVEKNRLRDFRGEIGYKFTDKDKLKTLYVTVEIQRSLADGAHGIIRTRDGYGIVARDIALRIEERIEDRLILLNEPDIPDEDDPYAEYKVPDDLMW